MNLAPAIKRRLIHLQVTLRAIDVALRVDPENVELLKRRAQLVAQITQPPASDLPELRTRLSELEQRMESAAPAHELIEEATRLEQQIAELERFGATPF